MCLSSRLGPQKNDVAGRIRPAGLVFAPCVLKDSYGGNNNIYILNVDKSKRVCLSRSKFCG